MYSELLVIIPTIFIIAMIIAVATHMVKGEIDPKSILMVVISIALIAIVLVPAINYTQGGESPEWQYDDYELIEGVETASGSLELVTIGENQYVHAKSLGDGSYTVDSVEHEVVVEKAQLDVFMLAGQSNAAYYRYDLDTATPTPAIGTAYYYGTDELPMYFGNNSSTPTYDSTYASYSMQSAVDSDGLKIAHLEGPFSAYYTEETGHKIYTINCAIPGVSSRLYIPGGIAYEYAKETFAAGMAAIDTDLYDVDVKSYIWIQGEADTALPEATYITNFTVMHDTIVWDSSVKFNEDYAFESCLISKVRATNGVNSSAAQIELASTISTVKLATSISDTFTVDNGLMLSDDLHYSQLGFNEIAEEIFEYLY